MLGTIKVMKPYLYYFEFRAESFLGKLIGRDQCIITELHAMLG